MPRSWGPALLATIPLEPGAHSLEDCAPCPERRSRLGREIPRHLKEKGLCVGGRGRSCAPIEGGGRAPGGAGLAARAPVSSGDDAELTAAQLPNVGDFGSPTSPVGDNTGGVGAEVWRVGDGRCNALRFPRPTSWHTVWLCLIERPLPAPNCGTSRGAQGGVRPAKAGRAARACCALCAPGLMSFAPQMSLALRCGELASPLAAYHAKQIRPICAEMCRKHSK